jgi:radical SAM protein with 4Fe4S-binding SPASM domain
MIEQFPQVVLLDTTNVCNARCPFCPLFDGEWQIDRSIRPAAIMKQDLYEKILAEISRWAVRPSAVIHSANAEILQDPKLGERLAALKKYGLADLTLLYTNGQFLNEKNAKVILDAGIRQIVVGFDGATKEVFEAHRVRCNYERVLGNIREFVRLRSESANKTRIEIKYVRTTKNEHEVQASYELFNSFLDPVLDQFCDALAVDWSDDPENHTGYYLVNKSTDNRLSECNYFEKGMQIQSDGKVAACCWDYNLNISDGGLGDLNETSVVEVWRGGQRQQLRAKLSDVSTTPKKCQSCIILHHVGSPGDDMMKIDASRLLARGPTSFVYGFDQSALESFNQALPI